VGPALADRGGLDGAAARGRGPLNRNLPPGTLVRLLALYLCWGTSIPALKIMVETVPPLGGAAAVFLLGGCALGLAAARRQRPTRAQLRRASVTGVLLLGGQGLATVALTEVSASLTAILIASNALWAALFSRVAGRPLDGASVLRLAAGFGGIVIVMLSAPEAATGGAPAAVAAALLSSVAWALGTVAAARGGALPRDPLVTGCAQLLAGGGVLLALAIAFGQLQPRAWDAASAGSLAAAAFLLVFDSLAGFVLYTSLVRSTPLPVVATYAYVTPVIAVLIGVLALGEPLSVPAVLGATVAVLAVGAQLRARPVTAST
jgi:drug/metabolite transporter (DMT)-like permease